MRTFILRERFNTLSVLVLHNLCLTSETCNAYIFSTQKDFKYFRELISGDIGLFYVYSIWEIWNIYV